MIHLAGGEIDYMLLRGPPRLKIFYIVKNKILWGKNSEKCLDSYRTIELSHKNK